MIYFLLSLFRWDTFKGGCTPTHCWSQIETWEALP